jgi:hypothetical protein
MEFNNFLRGVENPKRSDQERITNYSAAISLNRGGFIGGKWSNLGKKE